MPKKPKLSKTMTVAEFDNGYWYAVEIKAFAKSIGISSAGKLRKDELESLIRHYLRTGKVKKPARRKLHKTGTRDVDKGLTLDLPVENYTSNRETKDFIVREAQRIAPGLARKSGARYRLNRWREGQMEKGIRITYRDLVKQYAKLSQTEERFAPVPSGRYINFLSDFLASEKGSTHAEARKAWHQLKKQDIPKTYSAWKKFRS